MKGAKALAAEFAKEKKYVLVEEPDTPTDEKVAGQKPVSVQTDSKLIVGNDALTAGTMKAAMSHMKMSRSVRPGKGSKKGAGQGLTPFKTNLVGRFTGVGTANTNYAPVDILQPNSATTVTEAPQFAALFDEWRCTGVTTYVRVFVNTGTITTPPVAWGMAFDIANSGAYASVAGTMLSPQRLGPIAFTKNDGGMQVHGETGFLQKSFRVPNGLPSTVVSSQAAIGRNWTATSDTTSVVGYIKFCIDALGSGVIAEYDMFVLYHMEYRSRT